MSIEAIAYVAAAVLIYLAGLGTREAVRWALGEIAFTRAVRGELDSFAARYKEETGGRIGVIDDFPDPTLGRKSWLRDLPEPTVEPGEYQPDLKPGDEPVPDDEEYERARANHGAFRRDHARGDEQMAAWPANGAQHRWDERTGEHTRDLSAYIGFAHVESEVAAP